ncbi:MULTISPECIES: hypothetical protein [unclassified Nocardioides]|uniref:hypothetical protein n=1 Tax=unclassified Nocardioides TaxID=2615069 RepID=UPI0030154DF7
MRPLPDHLSPTRSLRIRTAAGLAALALLAVPLTACGGDASSTSADPAATPSGPPVAGASASADGGAAAPADPAPSAVGGSGEGGSGSGSGEGKSGSSGEGAGSDGGPATTGGGGGKSGSGPGAGGSGGADGGTPDGPAADPNSPFVVAATAVAARSRDQVTQLHAMGVATTGQGGLPADQLPALGANIRGELGRQIDDASMLPPPADSPAAKLVGALEVYRTLSGRLADWKPSGAALPAAWFARLQANDRVWKAALRDLGRLSEQDLLADLAPLAMPS